MIVIGIDPGAHTGFAVMNNGRLTCVETKLLHQAVFCIYNWHQQGVPLKVYVEDARQRKWYGERSYSKLQGAGSIKRDCSVWDEFLTDLGIDHQMVPPQVGGTKLTAEAFSRITGYKGRTSEHGRDAAMLIYGRRP